MSKNLTLAVPAILAASVFAVSINATSGRAANECLRAPNATAPKGSHWYYRIDRTTKRQCWYLGAEGQKVTRQATTRAPLASRPPAPRPVQSSQPAAAPQPAARELAQSTEAAHSVEAIESRFSQFWRNLYAPIEMTQQAPAALSTSYAEEPAQADAEDDMPLVWPVLTAAEAEAAAARPVVRHEHMLGILAGALALAGIIIALVYRLASIRRRKPRPARWDIASHTARVPRVRSGAPTRSPVQTCPRASRYRPGGPPISIASRMRHAGCASCARSGRASKRGCRSCATRGDARPHEHSCQARHGTTCCCARRRVSKTAGREGSPTSPTFSTGAPKQRFWGAGGAKTRVGSRGRVLESSVV